MATSKPEGQPEADSAEREAARAVSEFLEARNANPQVSPDEFAPGEPQAAEAFWKAVEGAGALVGNLGARNGEETHTVETPPTGPPRTIGGHRVLRVLGEGGMGIVYEAQQQHPRRAVALKVVRGGAYVDDHHLRLFQREAQTLARLRHPYIAAIYEAGRTDDGQHFFAMELVRGEPLKEYVGRKKLSMRERLGLFGKICEAINYAHQRGVIHRDLKPSNVLVDAEGNPKVLDFGLARITDADITVTTVVTELGRIQGTLPYMSPEQARGNPDEIDLRSDVYSLGVILYELLTDQLPYDVSKAMLHEAVRVICEEDPRRPSTISKTLRGDVETIALKALEKEPSRRYQSVSALAEDIQRYLADHPILARAPSAIYQFKKLVARHKAPFAFVAALFILITGFGIWVSVMYARADQLLNEAEQAREEAEQSRDKLEKVVNFQQSMLSETDAEGMGLAIVDGFEDRLRAALAERIEDQGELDRVMHEWRQRTLKGSPTTVALEVLDEFVLAKAVETIGKQFADQPVVRAALQQTVADTYRGIGLYEPAIPLQEAALRTRRQELGDDYPDTLTSINNMGLLLNSMGKLAEAEGYSREALEGRRRVLGDDHLGTLRSINNMGALLMWMGKLAEAESYMREALEGRRRVLGDEHPDTLGSINNMGLLLVKTGRLREAEAYYREALESSRRVLGDEHPHTLGSINNMGSLLTSMGRLREADAYRREALEGFRRVLGDDHPYTLTSISNMGGLLKSMGRLREAEAYYREALEGFRRMLGDDHPNTLSSINNMGTLLKSQGKLTEAEPYYREALETRRRVLGDDDRSTLTSINNMGDLFESMGKLAEAEPYYREALEGTRRVLGDDHPSTLASINNMGSLLQSMGELAEAEPYYREALEGYRRVLGDDHPQTLPSIHNMGGLLESMGKLAEAEALLAEAVDGARRSLPDGHWKTGVFLGGHGKCLTKLERYADAETTLLEAYGILETALGPEHKRTVKVIESLADLYTAWHEVEPDQGYDAKAAQWRAKLPVLATQPVSQPATQPTTSEAVSTP